MSNPLPASTPKIAATKAVLSPARLRTQDQLERADAKRQQRKQGKGTRKNLTEARKSEEALGIAKCAVAYEPNDIWAQVVYFYENYRVSSARGRPRPVSTKTTDAYIDDAKALLQTLKFDLNVRPRSLLEISAKNVVKAVQHWEWRKLSPSTLQNRFSRLKRFLKWMDKGHNLGNLKSVLADPTRGSRSYSAVTPKDWESLGVDVQARIAEVEAYCPITAMHLRLEHTFGLRSTEALSLKPHESDKEAMLNVTRGTKGGLGRTIPITTVDQRDLLERAKAIASKSTGLIGRYGHNMNKAKNHYYYVLRKFNITRSGDGITAHGLRHGYANDRYHELTGVASPVQGGEKVDRPSEMAARKQLSRELGHQRTQITSAYIGSFKHIDHTANKNRAALIAEVEQPAVKQCIQAIRAELAAQGRTATFYALDDAAEGKSLPKAVPLHISVQIEGAGDMDGEASTGQLLATSRAISQLTPLLTQTIGRKVYVVDNCVEPSFTTRLELFL